MHRRSVSGSATDHYTLQELLQNPTITHPPPARAHSGPGGSRFRAEAEAEAEAEIKHRRASAAASTSASASISRSSKGASQDDNIVCQSKLYDAYELQDLEQHLDRELSSFSQGSKTRSESKTRSDSGQQEAQKPSVSAQKPSFSASNPQNHHRSPGDLLQRVSARCPCEFCRSKTRSISSEVSENSSRQPVGRMPSLSSVSNIEIEPAEEASCSSKQPRAAEMSDSARPAVSMPRGFVYGVASPEPADLARHEQEAPRVHADGRPPRAHKLTKRKSHKWPGVKSLCRSMKRQNSMRVNSEDMFSPSHSKHRFRDPSKREFHHHHTLDHNHQVHHHHHHHHHVVDGGPVEEIDWPSPNRLEELT